MYSEVDEDCHCLVTYKVYQFKHSVFNFLTSTEYFHPFSLLQLLLKRFSKVINVVTLNLSTKSR
jgi:hypothetical protein